MDDPIQDSPHVVEVLTQGSPKEQEEAINTYFTPDASFTHPFCRTGSFEGSRHLLHGIYRWYKILSPTIHLNVNSVAYDETKLILYLNITQLFAIWAIPFHRSQVTLTTELHLTRPPHSRKYYIKAQNDLYQVDQFVQFFLPWGIGTVLVYAWHFWATALCMLGALVLAPITWLEQTWCDNHAREGMDGSMYGDGTDRTDRTDSVAKVTGISRVQQEEVKQFGNMQVVR